MTEQEKREKVIVEFEQCLDDSVVAVVPADTVRDALALLRAQEPRVMALEEVQVLCNNDVVWLEDKGNPKVIPGIVKSRHLWPHSVMMVTNFIRSDGRTVTAGDEDYGVRWRAWTSCPADEQREVKPWA